MSSAETFQLRIPASLVSELVGRLCRAYPNEGCGLLIGRDEAGDIAVRHVLGIHPLENPGLDDRSVDRFLISGREMLQAERASSARGLGVVGCYHSHPDGMARPSEFDRASAWPYFTYLITAVHQGSAGRTTAWVLDEASAQFVEQFVEVIPELQGARNN